MKISNCFKFAIILIFILSNVCSFSSLGIADELPLRQRWDPSIFRKNDEVGSVNWINNKKVLLSPHSATFTNECKSRMAIETIKNIIDFFDNSLDKSMIVKT